jgi:hypothetical protein
MAKVRQSKAVVYAPQKTVKVVSDVTSAASHAAL